MLSSYTIILLKTIRAKPILANLGKPVGKTFQIKCVSRMETSQMIFFKTARPWFPYGKIC